METNSLKKYYERQLSIFNTTSAVNSPARPALTWDYFTKTVNEFGLVEMRQKEFFAVVVDSVTGGAKKIDDWSNIACVDNAEAKSKENVIPAPMDIKAIRSSILVL